MRLHHGGQTVSVLDFIILLSIFFAHCTLLYHLCELLDLDLVLIAEVSDHVLLAVVGNLGCAVLPAAVVPVLSDHVAPHLRFLAQVLTLQPPGFISCDLSTCLPSR